MHHGKRKQEVKENERQILTFLYDEGPSRSVEISMGLRISASRIQDRLEMLREEGKVDRFKRGKALYYILVEEAEQKAA